MSLNLHDLTEKLIESKEQCKEKARLEDFLPIYKRDLQDSKEKLHQLLTQMQEEKADVEKLKSFSLQRLVAEVFGNKEDKIKKEEKEYIVAKLAYEDLHSRVESLEGEVKKMEERLNFLNGAEVEYQSLSEEKEKILVSGQHQNWEKIVYCSESISEVNAELKELEEALKIGIEINDHINELIKLIGNAEGWGGLDVAGGGAIVSSIKHSSIDKANNKANRVNRLIQKFLVELKDLKCFSSSDLDLKVKTFAKFSDIFLELFASDIASILDIVTQGTLGESFAEAKRVREQIESVVSELKKQKLKLQERATKAEKEKAYLLETIT